MGYRARPGITQAEGDNRYTKSGTGKSRGSSYFSVAGSTKMPTDATWYDWGLTTGTFVGADLQDFTESAGVLTYTGTVTKVFKVSAEFILRGSGTAGTGTRNIGISVNAATPAAQCQRSAQLGGSKSTSSVSGVVTLSTDDTVRIQSEGAAGGDATTAILYDLIGGMTVTE